MTAETITRTAPLKAEDRQLAADVLTNAVETGVIGYWAEGLTATRIRETDAPTPAEGLIGLIGHITVSGIDYEEPNPQFAIGFDEILAAMHKITHDDSVNVNRALRARIAALYLSRDYLAGEGGDGESDDVILQIAAFGELVYG